MLKDNKNNHHAITTALNKHSQENKTVHSSMQFTKQPTTTNIYRNNDNKQQTFSETVEKLTMTTSNKQVSETNNRQ